MEVNPPLPQELIDLIIDAAHFPGNTETLKAFSRVSNRWRKQSQQNIFKDFSLTLLNMKRIHSETSPPDADTMASPQFPTVFSYVRHLSADGREVSSPNDHREYSEVLRFFTEITSIKLLGWNFIDFGSGEPITTGRFIPVRHYILFSQRAS